MRFLICFIVAAMTTCCAAKKEKIENENQVDFQIVSAEYSNWLGGVPKVQGITITIVLKPTTLEVDSLFFRNQKTLPKSKKIDNGNLQISASLQMRVKPDISLHKEASQEYGNAVPTKISPSPYDLKSDECILFYRNKNKMHMVKIALKKGETKFYQ